MLYNMEHVICREQAQFMIYVLPVPSNGASGAAAEMASTLDTSQTVMCRKLTATTATPYPETKGKPYVSQRLSRRELIRTLGRGTCLAALGGVLARSGLRKPIAGCERTPCARCPARRACSKPDAASGSRRSSRPSGRQDRLGPHESPTKERSDVRESPM